MIYAKVDVKLRDHVRAHKAGAAMSTWLWALLYVREQETDGVVPEIALKLAWAGEKEARKHADRLVLVGLWERHEDGWRISKYEDKNDTKATISERRRVVRERVTKHRGNTVSNDNCNALHAGGVTRSTVTTVPGSGSGSGSESRGELERGPGEGPPPWFGEAINTVEVQTGEKLRPADSWLRYSGHRTNVGKPKSQQDAVYWLTTVMVPEARKERCAAADKRERDAKFDRQRGGVPESSSLPIPSDAEAEANARRFAERIARSRKGAA